MVSLIICSRTSGISNELATNIAETIGCEYELVVINNSNNSYSIFSAYNEGVKRSKGDVLCFMHDDIIFRTKNWGTIVNQCIANENIGILGVIGSYVVLKDYGYWDKMIPYVTGKVPYGEKGELVNDCNVYFDENYSDEVATIDGLWFCAQRSLFDTISFDTNTYTGFHFYEMDICMQAIKAGKKNHIIRNVEIVHHCHPQYNLQFCENMKLFHKKWDHMLPYYCGEAVNMPRKEYLALCEKVNSYFKLLYRYNFYKNDIEHSISFRLGNLIAKPYRFIIRLLK